MNNQETQQPPQVGQSALTDGLGANHVAMRPIQFEDGRLGWYIDHPDFYCDLEPDINGTWSVFFRDRATGKEVFGERQVPNA